MKVRKLVPAGLVLGLLAAGAALSQAQQSEYQKQLEQYNEYQAILRTQNPSERLQAIEAFMKTYPQSQYRVFVYPAYAQTAWEVKRYPTVIKAVDEFWALDREQVAKAYKESNPNITDLTIDGTYFQAAVLYTYSFLQSFRNGTPEADAQASRAVERARQGLGLHQKLYSQVQPPADEAQRKQFEAQKQQQEAAFHNVLAFVAWRNKDYATAAREYLVLVDYTPQDALMNYRLGLSYLQEPQPNYPHGFWHVARATALMSAPKSTEVKDYLAKAVSAYQQVVPECTADQVDDLIATASQSVHPPAGWAIVSAEQVNALRNELTVKRIFDDLKAGGQQEHLIWLASCGLELPELEGEVIEVAQNADNVVTLGVAVTQEASDAKQADVEVRVVAPPEAKNVKAGDVIRFTGILSAYQKEPQFQLKLKEGKVRAEDIPKTRPPRR